VAKIENRIIQQTKTVRFGASYTRLICRPIINTYVGAKKTIIQQSAISQTQTSLYTMPDAKHSTQHKITLFGQSTSRAKSMS